MALTERRARVLHGDCLTVLAGLDAADSVDAVKDGDSMKTADRRTIETEFLPLERFLVDDDA